MAHKTEEQISYNMSRIHNSNTAIENMLVAELNRRGFFSFTRNDKTVFGHPDVVFTARKLAIFCDSEFFHGYDWEHAKSEIKSHHAFWIPKIEKNIARDKKVTTQLQEQGWVVLRFWGKQLKSDASSCVDVIERILRTTIRPPYRTIDLCAGIGGIRRGFERTGLFRNVLSAEVDRWACKTYEHLYGDNPSNDLTSDEFKAKVQQCEYDVLLAGFPCQTFSRVGLGEGFENEEKGQIFFHIADIIRQTRPSAFFLENVDHLVTHDKGKTFRTIIDTLVSQLHYKVIGVSMTESGEFSYNAKSFVKNSRDFGVPQNRPRTYILGFDTERYNPKSLEILPNDLPICGNKNLYENLNDLLEQNVEAKYYMASGYLETLVRHKARQKLFGNGFGYRIINGDDVKNPIANTLLATGGSGKERNLIYDPRDDIAGTEIKGKKTPLNDKGIRVMTPTEWGKLQGFVNYAFLDGDGVDLFSFPKDVSDAQKYKQFGNSVTIPVIETMANFMLNCFKTLYSGTQDVTSRGLVI